MILRVKHGKHSLSYCVSLTRFYAQSGARKPFFLTKRNVSISSAHSASSASTKRNKERHLISRMQYQNSDKGHTFEKGPRGLEPFFRNVAVEPFLARPRKLTPLSEILVLALPDSGIGERDRVELGSTAACKANVYQCRCALLKCLSRNDCLHSFWFRSNGIRVWVLMIVHWLAVHTTEWFSE